MRSGGTGFGAVTAAMTTDTNATVVRQTRAAMDVPRLIQGGVSFDVLGGAVAKIAR